MKSGEVTIKDLARELGISPSTVSRALSGHPDISDRTIEKVQNLARKYHYRPNSIALSLRSSRTQTIGVIIPEIAHAFFANIISGIEDLATEKGYSVILCHSNEDYEREAKDVQSLFDHRVDGLLVGMAKTTNNYHHFSPFIDRGLPLVFFDRKPALEVSTVTVEDYTGASDAVAHLIEQGCERILHLAGPVGLSTTEQRLKGYRDALETNGLKYDSQLVAYCNGGINVEEAEQKISEFLNSGVKFDGVFANNDLTAIGAIRAIKSAGFAIPQEVAVIGFSNWQLASLIDPPLSSVVQPGYLMGQKAVELFFDRLDHPEKPLKHIVLSTELILRDSSLRK